MYASRMIVTFAALKGGVGKTTGTVYLGAALSEHSTVQLIDTDPQRSLTMWAQEAGEGFPTVKTILDRAVIRADAAGFDFTVIDTPPGNPDAINAAVAVAGDDLAPSALEISTSLCVLGSVDVGDALSVVEGRRLAVLAAFNSDEGLAFVLVPLTALESHKSSFDVESATESDGRSALT